MFNYAYVGGVQTPCPTYPGESVIDGSSMDDVADQIAKRIHSANREGKASSEAGNLMALATVAGQVEQHQERLEDVVDVISTLGEEQREQAQQIATLEGQVQSIPQPDLEQQREIAQEVLTLELRTRNETQAGLAAIRAEREAAAAEYQELSSLLSEQVTTAEAWRPEMEERIATATGEAALAALRPMLSWWKKVRPLLEGLRGITAISNPEPGVTEWTASPAVAGAAEPLVVRTKAAKGDRGYRGAQGKSQGVGGGSGTGAQLAGALVDQNITAPGVDNELRFRYLTNQIQIKGDLVATFKLTLLSDRRAYHTFTLWASAPDTGTLEPAEYTEAGEMSAGGFGVLVDYTWTIDRLPSGELRLQMRLNSNTPIRVQGGISSVTSHI